MIYLAYIIKCNIILALLCLLFQMLMHHDTYFGIRRAMLLGIYATALLLPLWNVQGWMATQAGTSEMAEAYASYVLPTLDVTAQRVAFFGVHQDEPGCGMWIVGFMVLWGLVYFIPVVWLTAKLLWQLGYILYLRCTCASDTILGVHVYRFPRSCSPFSFGPWIFISADEMGENELREVLIHERTHVRQWHTLDIILAQLFCIVFWWNPATWVLRREVRLNLEFIADAAVVGKDVDRRTYQYHLLGFASQMNVATISNNFNVLPLKRRIIMMNLRRTRRTGMVKYAVFVPVAALMLLLCNVDAMARALTNNAVVTTQDDNDKKGQIYENPEVKAEYPGGEQELYKFLSMNVKYPAVAQENAVQGRIIVSFVIEKDGSITDIKPIPEKKLENALNEVVVVSQKTDATPEQKEYAEKYAEGLKQLKEEAVRVVSQMPKWKPGRQNDEPVRVRFMLPIMFRLL